MRLNVKQMNLDDQIDWSGLIKNSSTATFFQRKEWLKLWVKHFSVQGEAKIFGIFNEEELIGISPLEIKVEIKGNRINFLGVNPVLGKELVSDFGDFIIKTGREKEVWEAVLREIDNGTMGQWNNAKVELNFIREDSPSFKISQELGGKAEGIDIAPYIDLPKTWEDYLGGLERHDRHELRRKIRKIDEEGVKLIDYNGDSKDVEEFFRLMSMGSEQKRNFLSKEMRSFFSELIKTFYPGQLSLSFLENGAFKIAASLTFLFKDEVLLYNSGFDPQYSYLSPGLVLKAYLIRKSIEEGKKRFDFLRGGEKYKYDLGGKERKLYKVTF